MCLNVFYMLRFYICRNVFYMLWFYMGCDVFYVLQFYICHDVFYMLWCITYVVMYFMGYDILHMSWYIGPIVSGEKCGWHIYELTPTYLSRLYHITQSCIHLLASHMVLNVLPRTSGVALVYGWHYTHTILCVMHWWEPHVHQYHVIYGGVM